MSSTGFGDFMTVGGFNQKTVKEDLFVKVNHVHPRRNRPGKTLEQSRRQTTITQPEPLPCGAVQPHLQAGRPMGPRVSLSTLRQFSTALKIESTPLLKVDLIRGSWFDIAPYIYAPVPPPAGHPEIQKPKGTIHILVSGLDEAIKRRIVLQVRI